MSKQGFLNRWRKDETGTTIIEVAILFPVLISMLIGVFQVGLYLQAQNSVRSLAGEMSRYMAVEAQKNNVLTDSQIEIKAFTLAVTAPYMLQADRLQVYIDDSPTQDMDRVRKIDVNMIYDVPSLLGFSKVPVLTLDYTRTVFVPAPPPPEDEAVGTGDGTDGGVDGTPDNPIGT
ncbi:TadE/TadG family type IV pilus assembly protein [Croceicoccus naphthovorans]|uniref:TadE-like domain-containing protein n=1 Tax=Croceicoccus naphthovorans TaxID=1348774 RepID=A0A0G3XH86_9SPHN|nr:TadE family protein [Croceicoccus naphthovorans]AKM09989.1 hypothetical protein AB433_08380 [Croceicoccus naphthovorans]MBB3991139.1 Flp pilus assembly pilin Flp [Croceicoccus naphthovorans]